MEAIPGRSAKAADSRQAVVRVILSQRPDVLALQEVGSRADLDGLARELAALGLAYPHRQDLRVEEQAIRCAVLSRFPIRRDRSDENAEFLLYGRVYSVLRGITELDIQVSPHYEFTLFNVHLKSQLPTWYADQADYRLAEAVLLRKRIDGLLARAPERNFVVLGDLNDTPDSRVIRTVKGRGRDRALWDARPVELHSLATEGSQSRISWTHHFEKKDAYYRYDYLFLSPAMKPEWEPGSARIAVGREWALASDHRMICLTIRPEDR